MGKMRVLVVACGLVVLAACGVGGGDGSDAVVKSATPGSATPGGAGDGGEMRTEDPGIDEPIEPMDDGAAAQEEPAAESADAVMTAAANDVQQFWTETYPEVYGEPFVSLEGGLWSYGPDTPPGDLPPCGDIRSYDEIAGNAFYCPSADLVAWDREALVAPFIDEFGAFTAAIIMAHEVGHAVQARSGVYGTFSGVLSETQADCFAGAWVAHVVDGGSQTFRADADELDVAVAGLIEIRDAPGSDADDPAAHGAGFDRVSAFSDGFSEGAARCRDYEDDPPVITEATFEPEEASSGGDATPDELVSLLVPDLEAYYADLFAAVGEEWQPLEEPVFFDPATDEVSCGDDELSPEEGRYANFYCEADNTVYIDDVSLVPALAEIGDFALGADLARQWAFAAQAQLGTAVDDERGFLHADCLTGLYAGDLYFGVRDDSELSLSPGDLDEAIISFLAFSDADSEGGSPFERSDAFRTGFLGELADCDSLTGG